MKIGVINGPNLNMLGTRETDVYGGETLEEILERLAERAAQLGVDMETFQSNSEGDIVSRIQSCRGTIDGIIINPAAYTHTSVAVRDAVAASEVPCVEVHLSNIYAREEFRSTSLIAPVCMGQICGLGGQGYILALDGLVRHLERSR